MKTILHGECQLSQRGKLPKDSKRVKCSGDFKIVAESEVSFNHHVVDIHDGVEFYEKDGTLYLKNDTETKVRCVLPSRHDDVVLDPGVWEVGFQQEYDYLTQEKRNVAD